jgi:hypothetical protein
MLTLTSLPVDIIIIVLGTLTLRDFAALSLTCHLLHSIVSYPGYLNFLPCKGLILLDEARL